MKEAQVQAYLDVHQEELYQLLSKLLQFDTQNFGAEGRERPCAEYIEGLYRELGLRAELYCPDEVPGVPEHPEYLAGHNMDTRANVSGEWDGENPERVMIAAHIDTMPTGDLEKWEESPFSGSIRAGRIYGLGAGDNKFGIAGGYFAIKAMQSCGVKLKKSVVLTSYCDEEHGGGNGTLAACLRYPCELYVNLDGGNYELWTAAIGGGGFEMKLHKEESTDRNIDVYHALAAVMRELEQFAEKRRRELHDNPLYTGSDMERSAFRLARFGATGSTHTDAQLSFMVYTTSSREEIVKELSDILERVTPPLRQRKVTTTGFLPITRFFQYSEAERAGGAVEFMKQAAEEMSGKPVKECGACLTDLSLFHACGSKKSFNFGILRDFALPGGAHQPNEYVDCKQFLEHTKALTLFLMRYCEVAEE